MNSQELEVILKLRDEASAQWKKVADEATKSQTKIKESTEGATSAVDSHGKFVDKLTGFYREEVREQRLQNFLFRQSQEVIGAASIALTVFYGASSKGTAAMKQLSAAMNTSFVVFQGLSNALTLALGPWGMVIAGIAAGIVLFKQLSDAASTAVTNIAALGEASSKFNEGIGAEEASREVEILSRNLVDFETELAAVDVALANHRENSLKTKTVNVEMTKGLEARREELQRNVTAYQAVIAPLKALIATEEQRAAVKMREEAAEQIRFQNEQNRFRELMTNLGRLSFAIPVLFEKVRIASTTAAMTIKKVLVPAIDDIRKRVEESVSSGAWESLEAKMQTMASIGAQVFTTLAGALQSAFEGQTKTVKDIFKAILKTVIDSVQALVIAATAAMWAKGIFLFGASLGADIAYLALATTGLQWLRAAVGRMHTGGTAFVNLPSTKEVPILVRGQETIRVNTPEQEAAMQRRTATLFRREDAGPAPAPIVANVTVNVNAPGTPIDLVRQALVDGLRQTGLPIEKYVVNSRNRIALG